MYLWNPPDITYLGGEPVYPSYLPGSLFGYAFLIAWPIMMLLFAFS